MSSPSNPPPVPAADRTVAPTYAAFAPAASLPPQNTSPLLSSTPPTITKALSQAYPLLLAADYSFALLTWTCDDPWQPFLLTVSYSALVLYSDFLIRYVGHLLAVAAIAAHVYIALKLDKERSLHPTLDSIVHTLTNLTTRANLFFSPVTSLSLSPHDVTRLLFTTLFMSPVYMIIAFFVVSPRTIILLTGVAILTYHSVYARVTRAVLWRSRTVRLVAFYLTGLDFARHAKTRVVSALTGGGALGGVQSKDGKPVRFVYVLYENQRRWLGIGWTANLLAYERAPWTDEFLNESLAPDAFKLPSDSDSAAATAAPTPSPTSVDQNPVFGGVSWRWVDKTWKLDLTNDGALVVPKGKLKLSADPGSAVGWVYYDNTWKKPSTEDTFLKYTRRRRWVRTAELVNTNTPEAPPTAPRKSTEEKVQVIQDGPSASSGVAKTEKTEAKPRKSLRFADE